MSLEFSRRSFLKYTAVAAVAVAGSSLLTGCGDDQYQPTGGLGDTLKLMGEFTLKNAKLESEGTAVVPDKNTENTYNLVCPMSLTCTSSYGLNIVPANFQVEVTCKASKNKVTTYHAFNTDETGDVTLSNSNNYLSKDDKALETTLTVKNIKLHDGDTVKVKFWPRPQASEGSQAYTRAFCTWNLTVSASSTTDKNMYMK